MCLLLVSFLNNKNDAKAKAPIIFNVLCTHNAALSVHSPKRKSIETIVNWFKYERLNDT